MLKKVLCLFENQHSSQNDAVINALQQQLQREKALRISYEKALGLPFYNRQQTRQALLASAAQGKTWAEDVLQESLASGFESGIEFEGVSENQSV